MAVKSKPYENKKYNLGIVGGGRTCSKFFNFLERELLPYPDIRVVGVCDINPDAKGMIMASKAGLFTTGNLKELIKIKSLDAVIDLTNNKALSEIIAMGPEGVNAIEHKISRLIKYLFEKDQELIKAKEQASLEKKNYDILFQQTDLGVVVLEPDFVITDANNAYLKSVGKQRADILGKTCHEVVKGLIAPCPVEEPGFDCPLVKTLKTGKSSYIIHEYTTPDDKIIYFNISTYPIKNRKDEVVSVIELWRDITSEITNRWEKRVKRIEADMRKMIQEDRLVSLGKLVASSVHEINNPIQGLLTFSHIMAEMTAKESLAPDDLLQIREFVSHMTRELDRCGKIVGGLLSFARESALDFVDIDINDILHTAISLIGHKLELSEIELKTALYQFPLIVNGDSNQLQQCFLNLIFNAIEAMPDGGMLSISSGLKKKKRIAWIEVRDNGCGIKKADKGHIFDPFFTTKDVGQGTGLGLSIVYGIIKDHDGDITVKSISGQGACFIISVPCI